MIYGYLRIYCDFCRDTWDVFARNINDNGARVCPHCGSKIKEKTWKKVYDAVKAIDELNAELVQQTPQFEAEYHPNMILRNVIDTPISN